MANGNSGSGIDTGTGGFPIGENNARQSYDVGAADESTKPTWSGGDVAVDKTVKDLSKGTKITLATYLSDTTLGKTKSSPTSVPNKYPVNHIAGANPDDLDLSDEKGYPTAPRPTNNTFSYTPAETLSSRSEAATNLNVLRGRQEQTSKLRVDGNTLLKDATGELREPVNPSAYGGKLPEIEATSIADSSPIKNYYGNTRDLSKSVIYNRFNSDSEYQTQNAGSNITSQQFSNEYKMGTSEAVRDVSFGRLAQVGRTLMQRASGELNAAKEGFNPSSPVSSLTANLPGTAQTGLFKVNTDELTAESVLKDLTDESIPELSLVDVLGESWGSLNNPDDRFAGVSSLGMQLIAVAMLVALSVVILLMAAIFSIGSTTPRFIVTDADGRGLYGAYRYEASGTGNLPGRIVQSFWKLLGIDPTVNPISRCIPVGALLFFGINDSQVTSATMAVRAAAKGLEAMSQSPGYYTVMGRSVTRSLDQVRAAFDGLKSKFDSPAAILSGANQIYAIIASLRISRFIRLINIFANLGDRVITASLKSAENNEDMSAVGPTKRFQSEIDMLPSTNALKGRMMKVGYGVNPLTLSWASYRAPDMLIVPSVLVQVQGSTAARKMGIHNFSTSIPTTDGGERSPDITQGTNRYVEDNVARIDTEDREKFEEMLEAEYVPFYIHDVRTNDVVSFHAFLASLTDDYTANYDTQEAFGRVEAIKIYKSTNRKIGFSFYVASTNEKDFDAMWLKINKLTTMVYPQFTEGRIVTDGSKNTIYAPFSQSISASPMVRVRIGDLITSNYSKFNLARLFGYSYAGTKFNGKESGTYEGEADEKTRKKKLIELKGRPGTFFTTKRHLNTPVDSKLPKEVAEARRAPAGILLPKGLVLKVEKRDKDNAVTCRVEVASGIDRRGILDLEIEELKKIYGGGGGPTVNIIGRQYVLREEDLIPTDSTLDRLRDESSGEYSTAVLDFMSDNEEGKGNAIARSFRSSGGKGLAGFIESLSFDWYDKVTWTTDEGPGRKAPKMCKVTVSFAPIHDITPGLDHMGANRAPIYRIKGIG